MMTRHETGHYCILNLLTIAFHKIKGAFGLEVISEDVLNTDGLFEGYYSVEAINEPVLLLGN